MHINNEIEEMINGFKSAACLLKQNGKLIIISFHSIEDRIAKNFLRSDEAKNLNLKKQGINTRVVGMHTIKPIDKDEIIDAALNLSLIHI